MLNVYKSLDFNMILSYSIKVVVIFAILCFFVYILTNTERILNMFLPFLFDNHIEVVDLATNRKKSKMPITKEEVKWFLQEVRKKNPTYLKGIQRIYLIDRPATIGPNQLGSFTPHSGEGKIIQLYTMNYLPERKLYTVNYHQKDMKMGYTERQAKEILLSTLGHEIGHNHLYNKTKILYGEKAEEFCDKFAESLGLVTDRLDEGAKFFKNSKPDEFIAD